MIVLRYELWLWTTKPILKNTPLFLEIGSFYKQFKQLSFTVFESGTFSLA